MTNSDLNESIIKLIVTESHLTRLEIMKEHMEMNHKFNWMVFLITANTVLILLVLIFGP